MYRRANLSRTVVPVVALLLAAHSTGAFARESRGPDPDYDRQPIVAPYSDRLGAKKGALDPIKAGVADLNRTIVALIAAMTPVLIAHLCRVERI